MPNGSNLYKKGAAELLKTSAEREAYSNRLASQSVFICFKIKGNILNVYLSYFVHSTAYGIWIVSTFWLLFEQFILFAFIEYINTM